MAKGKPRKRVMIEKAEYGFIATHDIDKSYRWQRKAVFRSFDELVVWLGENLNK